MTERTSWENILSVIRAHTIAERRVFDAMKDAAEDPDEVDAIEAADPRFGAELRRYAEALEELRLTAHEASTLETTLQAQRDG